MPSLYPPDVDMSPSDMTNVSIVEPQPAALLTPAERALAQAQAMVVDSPEMADLAGDDLRAIKSRYNDLEAQRKALVKPLDEHRARLMDLFRKPLSILEQAERAIKGHLLTYSTKCDEERRREEARLAEIARKEQARIQEQARKAEAAGKLEKAENLQNKAAAVPTSFVLPAAAKVAGVHTTVTYDAECDDLLALCAYVVANPMFVNCLQVNPTALRAQARSMKEAFCFPGCRLVRKTGVSARAA